MALPTSKQSPKENNHLQSEPEPHVFTPEFSAWEHYVSDASGENVHAQHAVNFDRLLEIVQRNRPIHKTEHQLRYTRGHPRKQGQRLWLPYSTRLDYTKWYALPEATADDHVLVTHPVSEIWTKTETASIPIFPHYPQTEPRNGIINSGRQKGHALDGYYLSDYGVIQVAYGRISRLMPYGSINLQIHEYEVKLVWKAGAANKLDLGRYVFERRSRFTQNDWLQAAHQPDAFIQALKNGFLTHSGEPWTPEHDLMLTDILRDAIANAITWAVQSIQTDVEPHDKALVAALKNLYEFKHTVRPAQQWASYSDYLDSPEWQAKRQEVIKRSGGFCESCMVNGVLRRAHDVHHIRYPKNLGEEPATDLVHLCREHHELAHGTLRK